MEKNFFTLVIALILGLGISANLMAVDYYVNPSGSDDTGDGSSGSPWATIRYAVNNVSDPTTASIVIHVSGDTYTLDSDDIDIDRSFTNLTIQGAGAGTTIVQAHASPDSATDKVFEITPGETVTIKYMTIRHGKTPDSGGEILESGGGVYNDGTLTLTNCTVSDNTANLRGGGIYNDGTLTLTNCTISNNNTVNSHGGGIYSKDTLTLTNCTVSDDTSILHGGGIYVWGTATITNCTIANNSASGDGGGVRLYDTSSHFYIKNTIIANNTAGGLGDDFRLESGTVHDNGYNIVENSSGYTFSGTGDITGEQANLNLSSTLESNNTINGTYTLKTTLGSVAIDAADPVDGANNGVAIPSQDQRGANRNFTTDIGAYEYYDDDASLPVKLSSFTATTNEDRQVILHWITQTEVNNIGFAIYRSEEENGNYTKIAFINVFGNTAMPTDYNFTDKKVEAGKTYFYYLEDIDIVGVKNKNTIIKVVVPDKPMETIPTKSSLRQNFPNPFNPETWIPYHLAQDASVNIHIYNIQGQLVQHLDLGKQAAGSYLTKDKSAYWDGRNERGENVASGVYWYRLQAGEFDATRRMVILK